MKKKYGIMMGAAIVVTGGLMAVAMAPSPATAAVAVNDDGSLKLFGDARLRWEYDNRTSSKNTDAIGASEHRDRFRLRARFGVLYAPNDTWSMGIRLRTESDALNSPHQTTGFFGGSSGRNQDFGLDRVFIKVSLPVLGGKFSAWGGKNGLNLWQQDEVWWDEDIQPEGVAGTFKTSALPIAGTLTINGGGFILSEGNFESATPGAHDGALAIVQGVYQTKAFGPKLTVAVNYAKVINPDDLATKINGAAGNPFQSSRYTGASIQLKGSNWRIGGDIIDSNAQTEDAAYVVQARYKPDFLHGIGLRIYYYRVEGYSLIADGIFTQDNFANPGNFGLSNFQGERYQIDYKFNKHTSIDFRAYIAKRIDTAVGARQSSGTVTDALMNRRKHDRYQVNLNMKF